MIILGVSSQHDAGAALLVDGRVAAAVNEERLNREKLFWGVPERSIREVLRVAGVPIGAVDAVAFANLMGGARFDAFAVAAADPVIRAFQLAAEVGIGGLVGGTQLGVRLIRAIYGHIPHLNRVRRETQACLRDRLGYAGSIVPYDHHLCHAASAYYSSGWDRCSVITMDAAGDGYCSRIYAARGGRLTPLHQVPFYHSIASYYGYATHICGFTEGRHEGKITGLAAYGRPDRPAEVFARLIAYDGRRFHHVNRGGYLMGAIGRLRRGLAGIPREDIAAGAQRHLEEQVVPYVRDAVRRTGEGSVALAGGLFANVKLNQRLREIPEVTGIWIHPHMGDGGLAVGAALTLWAQRAAPPPPGGPRWPDVYLGPSWTPTEIERILDGTPGVRRRREAEPEREIARLLAAGKVVARFAGRMEYGPRALGNRSILYQATDPTVNDWLNKRLRRTEFMPFAPILLAEDAPEYLKEFDGRSSYAAEFMTITYDVTDRCRREAPAVVHVDGTARPQVVTAGSNPSLRRILEHYRALTGLRVLINTSFNLHEEPIVCSPQDAIRAFLDGRLDVLALEDHLVERKEGD
jgi:carbamoyltransferase